MARMIGKTHGVDVGGRKCSCCYEAPKHWKSMNRSAKRRERNTFRKEIALGLV